VTGRVCFGDFVLDPETRELCRGGDPIPLSPKAYQLLEILVANRPRALSKIALQERLWPDAFVVDKNLVNLIGEIRKALDDDPTHPRYVRTVHRFGYAFREGLGATTGISMTVRRKEIRFRLIWAEGRAGLSEGEHVLGRDPELELFLDAPGVSRRHALISIVGEEATLEDLGSKNGTFVKGQRVASPTVLGNGDVVWVGPFSMTFRAYPDARTTRTSPRPAAPSLER
jgi:DNA-binding winged helix-turn-helix (wHTH) protein